MVINRIEFMKLLEEFYLTVLSFGIKFLEDAKLPVYKGPTLRLVLERGLNKVSCISSDILPFYILAKNLIKRVKMLRYFYGKKITLFTNYKDLINLSLDVRGESSQLYWYDCGIYSSRQKVRVKLGGLKGTISGDIEKFLLFTFLGSYIYIGKGTSLGLGKYEILQEEV